MLTVAPQPHGMVEHAASNSLKRQDRRTAAAGAKPLQTDQPRGKQRESEHTQPYQTSIIPSHPKLQPDSQTDSQTATFFAARSGRRIARKRESPLILGAREDTQMAESGRRAHGRGHPTRQPTRPRTIVLTEKTTRHFIHRLPRLLSGVSVLSHQCKKALALNFSPALSTTSPRTPRTRVWLHTVVTERSTPWERRAAGTVGGWVWVGGWGKNRRVCPPKVETREGGERGRERERVSARKERTVPCEMNRCPCVVCGISLSGYNNNRAVEQTGEISCAQIIVHYFFDCTVVAVSGGVQDVFMAIPSDNNY